MIPSWVMAVAAFLACLAQLWRARRDRRQDGYVGVALALFWLAVVYALAALGWVGLDDPALRSSIIRYPILLLIATLAFVAFVAVRNVGRRA